MGQYEDPSHVNFESFFENMLAWGYNGDYTVETTALGKDGRVDTDMLNDCFKRIREYIARYSGH